MIVIKNRIFFRQITSRSATAFQWCLYLTSLALAGLHVDDVTVLDHVVLTLLQQLAGGLDAGLILVLDPVVLLDHLS